MKRYKIMCTDLLIDGKTFSEGSETEFDEKKKNVIQLVESGLLLEIESKDEPGKKQKPKAEEKNQS